MGIHLHIQGLQSNVKTAHSKVQSVRGQVAGLSAGVVSDGLQVSSR